jgi:hypothetical protein
MLFPLRGGQVTLGRGTGAEIPLDDGYVSRAHALLRGTQEGYVLEDLGSSGGTTVNGRRLTGPHRLRHHDLLRFGPFVEARFEQLVDVDQTIVLPADSDATMLLTAPADVEVTRPVGTVPPPVPPPAEPAVASPPPPPPSEVPTSEAPVRKTTEPPPTEPPTTALPPVPPVRPTAAWPPEPPTTALPPVPPADPISAAYHHQVTVERDKAMRRAARTKRRAGWLMVAGLILLLAGGATYGWILLRYYTKVVPDTGRHPDTLRLFGDPVNGVPVGKIAFGVAIGGLVLLLVGIIVRIVAARRRRRARDLLVPFSAAPAPNPPSPAPRPARAATAGLPHGQPPPAQPPQSGYGQAGPAQPVTPPEQGQAQPHAPLPLPTYPPMTPMEPYPPRPGWPRL